MKKLNLVPDSASYSAVMKPTVLSVELGGGPARYRRDLLVTSYRVICQWILNDFEYQYLSAFIRNSIDGGSDAFHIDLILDGPEISQHEAHVIPGTYSLRSVQAGVYTVSAELDAVPNVTNAEFDILVVSLWDACGNGLPRILRALERFIQAIKP